jgi:hypothetical protein
MTRKNGIVCTFQSGDLPWYVFPFGNGNPYIRLELTITLPEVTSPSPLPHYPTNPVQGFLQHEQRKEIRFKTWASTSYKFARLLLDPAAGDVVFVVRDADNSPKKLYAYKSIPTGNSEYFESGMVN